MFGHLHRHGSRMFLGILAIFAVSSLLVMLLWNAIMPGLLGAGTMSYLQAAGLLLLCRILFGGLGPFFAEKRRRERFREMSPEERELFAQRMHERFHGHCRRGHGRPAPDGEDVTRNHEA